MFKNAKYRLEIVIILFLFIQRHGLNPITYKYRQYQMLIISNSQQVNIHTHKYITNTKR